MESTKNFFDLKATDIDENEFKFSSLKGSKAILIVNVACECGLTPQYAGLTELYKKYKDNGLEILGFPCNQFGRQEPGTPQEIKDFVKKYDVTFKLFSKCDVNGPNAHEVYNYLRRNSSLYNSETDKVGEIIWNFGKFLVNKDGSKVQYFPPKVVPADLEKPIQDLLSA